LPGSHDSEAATVSLAASRSTCSQSSANNSPDRQPVNIRLPADVIKRADALVPRITDEAVAQGFTRVSRSVVVKRALLEGLRVLEEKYK